MIRFKILSFLPPRSAAKVEDGNCHLNKILLNCINMNKILVSYKFMLCDEDIFTNLEKSEYVF